MYAQSRHRTPDAGARSRCEYTERYDRGYFPGCWAERPCSVRPPSLWRVPVLKTRDATANTVLQRAISAMADTARCAADRFVIPTKTSFLLSYTPTPGVVRSGSCRIVTCCSGCFRNPARPARPSRPTRPHGVSLRSSTGRVVCTCVSTVGMGVTSCAYATDCIPPPILPPIARKRASVSTLPYCATFFIDIRTFALTTYKHLWWSHGA